MATHLTRDCRVADFEAKRAIRTGHVDRKMALDGIGVIAKAPRALAVAGGDHALADDPFCLNLAGSREANRLFEACRGAPASTGRCSAREDAVGPDTAPGDSTSCNNGGALEKRSAVQAIAAPADDDKENRTPPTLNVSEVNTSTARKRRLEDSRLYAIRKRVFKPHEPTRKRLFDDSPASGATDCAPALPPPPPPASPPSPPPHALLPPPPPAPPLVLTTDESRSVVRELAIACIAESVPVSFLSSAAFEGAMKRCRALPESADLRELSAAAVRELNAQNDALCESMRLSSSCLTLCISRASQLEPGRALVYLVDEQARSVLHSHQRRCYRITAKPERALWHDELRRHFESVAEHFGRPFHLCVADYSADVRAELIDAIEASATPSLLVGGCMLQEFKCHRETAMPALADAPSVVKGCVELALLVNEAESAHLSSRELDAAPLRMSVPAPRSDQLVSYAVLLKQMLRMKHELVERYQRAPVASHSRSTGLSELLGRAKVILDAIQDQWAMVSDTLQLLLPLAAAELLTIRANAPATAASSPTKLTSGVFVCLEMWLSAALSRSPLLSSADKTRSSVAFLRRQRRTRRHHQLAALLLDPRLAGVGLSASGRCAARACVTTVAQRVFPSLSSELLTSQLVAYENRTDVFAGPELWREENTADPTAFWRTMQATHELQQVALLVCSFSPVSPAVSDQAMTPTSGSDPEEAGLAAQVRHLLHAHGRLQVPGSVASRDAAELLAFLTGSEANEPLGASRTLPDMEQFCWKPTADDSAPVTQQSVATASEVYATALTAAVNAAATKLRDSRASAFLSPTRTSRPPRLNVTATWIDTSDASLRAMQSAVGRVCASQVRVLTPTDTDRGTTVVSTTDADRSGTVGTVAIAETQWQDPVVL
ncbi:hypothetical protein PybrP1_012021 [[Pythium] brassicae (nom. inval.)]|nr:hypothetical protein PybrP1_012021 [[Pythium] brassicae (nom. inval.)]